MPAKQNKKELITSKKQKFIGFKTLIDPETGETYPMQINALEERDFNFHKIWFQHFVNGLDGIANQKLRLAFWIIDNLDKENKLVMTQKMIAEKTGMSLQTVNRTIQALCENAGNKIPFLQKIHVGAYRVNPQVIFKGSHSNRMGICFQYTKTKQEQRKNERYDEKMSGEKKSVTINLDYIKELRRLALNYPLANAILEFLVEQMDAKNNVEPIYENIQTILTEISQKRISIEVIKENIKILENNSFVKENKGVYRINPKIYFRE